MAVELNKATILAWRRHISTEAGMEGMLFLREKIPNINASEQHKMIFDAGRVEGFKEALNCISEILAVRQIKEEDPSND